MQATNEPMRFVVPFDHEILSKARTTKYKRRWRGKDGKWQYEYETPEQEREHKAHLERETWKEIQADMASKITERYDDAHALQRLTEIGSDLYQMQATSQLPSGGYERDDAGLSLMDMRSWNNLGDVYSDRERLKRMRLLLAKYKGQLGANEEGEHFEEYVKLGLWDALRAKQEGDPPRLKPEKNRFGGVNLPLVGDRLKGKSWDNYRDTMRKYKDWGLRFDGTDRAWYVRQADLHTFPWDKMQADLESFGIGMEDLPTFPEPKEAREEEPTPPPPTDVDTTIEAIQRRRINDTVAVTVIKEGEHKGKYAFYSTFSRDFNDIFSNKTGVLTGITEYVRELGHARVTDNRHLVDEALERIRERMPGHTIVIDPKVKATQDAQNEALQAAQKPIPEVTKHLAQGVDLFPFQNAGTRFLIETDGNALIGDEMGLGKTMQTLAYAAAKGRKVLVVCPRVVRKNWLREATRFFPEYFKGRELKSADLRKTGQPDLSGDNIVTVNYESLHKFLPAIEAGGFDTIVIDESHRMKNPKAKITQTLKKLAKPMKHRILLSGTAIKNKKVELYEQLELIKPGMFRSPNELKMATTGGVWHKLKGVYMARAKKDVLKDLPPKISSIVRMDVPLDTLPATPKDIGEISQAKADLAIAKTGATVDFVQELLSSSDSNVLVFSDSKQAANELKRKLGDVAVLHTGDTSEKAREAAISHFDPSTRRPGDPVRVFVATTASAGIGINLQTADKVVFNDLPWTPADLRQAEDRAYRIGTESAVNVYWNTVDGHEFDELIADTIKRKYELSKKVLEGKQLTPAERKWMDSDVSPKELIAKLRGETPPEEPASASEPTESKKTQAEPVVEAPPQPLPETKAAHVEGTKGPEPEKVTAAPAAKPKAERPKMVIKPPALSAKAPKPPPQTYAEQKAAGEKLVKIGATIAERAAEMRDHVSTKTVPDSLRGYMDTLHAEEYAGKEAKNPFVPMGVADKLEIWYRANVGRTVEGGKVEAVGSNAWRWRGGGEEITLTRDPKNPMSSELTYSSKAPEPPPPSKPPEMAPEAVPKPEEGAQTAVEPKPTPKPEQTAKPAPGAHVGPRKPTGAGRRQAKLEAAGQLALFKSRRPRFVVSWDGFDATMWKVDRLIKAGELNGAMDLIKAAGHKYLRRIPIAGGGKRKWRYVYSETSTAMGAEHQVGEKIKLTHEGKIGHYEIESRHSGGWLTVRHDETGGFLSIHEDELRGTFKVENQARIDAAHERLVRTLDAARKHGTRQQQDRAKNQLEQYRKTWGIEAADKPAEVPQVTVKYWTEISRDDMPGQAEALAQLDEKSLQDALADLDGRIQADAKSARGVPISYMRWRSVVQLALETRQDADKAAKAAGESTDDEAGTTPIAPPEAEPKPEPTKVAEEQKPAEAAAAVPEPTPAPVPAKAPKKPAAPPQPKAGLQQTGDHIWGSRKDLAALAAELTSEKLDTMNFQDAAYVVQKKFLVPAYDLDQLRAFGQDPGTAHMTMALFSAITSKPTDTAEGRKAYFEDVRRVLESTKNVKTEDEFYQMLGAMDAQRSRQSQWGVVKRFDKRQDAIAYYQQIQKENPKKTYRAVMSYNDYKFHVLEALPRMYDSLGSRFTGFIERKGKVYRDARNEAYYATAAHEKGRFKDEGINDGWEYLAQRGVKKEEIAKSKREKTKSVKEELIKQGQTSGGVSAAKEVAGEVVREGAKVQVKDANPDRLRDTFNLREVDYGNYMTQADREYHTQALEGAMHDFAEIMGVEPALLSFKGRLGIAMGARGRGKHAAHYEPGAARRVINITKFAGGGSLAHEWGHALDNIVSEHFRMGQGESSGTFLSDSPAHNAYPPAVRAAIGRVMAAITKHPDGEKARKEHKSAINRARSAENDAIKAHNDVMHEYNMLKAMPKTQEDKDKSIANEQWRVDNYRAQLRDLGYRKGRAAEEKRSNLNFWIESRQKGIERIKAEPFQTEADREKMRELQTDIEKARVLVNERKKTVARLRAADPEATEYMRGAIALGKKYWAAPEELFARAFETHIEDRLLESNRRNTYLVDGTTGKLNHDVKTASGEPAQPYPQGEERKRIGKAMSELLDVLSSEGYLAKALRSLRDARFVLRK